MTNAQRRTNAAWLREQLGELTRWIDTAPHRWPHRRIVVAMRAIEDGDKHWRVTAAEVLLA